MVLAQGDAKKLLTLYFRNVPKGERSAGDLAQLLQGVQPAKLQPFLRGEAFRTEKEILSDAIGILTAMQGSAAIGEATQRQGGAGRPLTESDYRGQ